MPDDPTGTSELWRALLMGERPGLLAHGRSGFKHLPAPPRCKFCNAPFAGFGGAIVRRMGFAPWPKNPRFCQKCHTTLAKLAIGGAEVEISVLFADVRGSTTLAEQMRPSDFRALIQRFYQAASQAVVEADGIIDNYVGDGLLALFIPAWTGPQHAARAIGAARHVLHATGNDGSEPWLPVGAGVHTGTAFVGIVDASGEAGDFTALGDTVNTASRLSASAAAGEVLVSLISANEAAIDLAGLEHRTLELKGKAEPFEAVALGART